MENQTEENQKTEAGAKAAFESADDIANDLYTTYCKAVGGIAYNGDPLPTWEEFKADVVKQKQANGWLEVAIRAYNRFSSAGQN